MVRSTSVMCFFMPGIVVIMLVILGCLSLDGQKWTLSKPILPLPPIAREIGALVKRRLSEGFGIADVLARASGGLQNWPVDAAEMLPFSS